MGSVTLTNLIARSRSRADMPIEGFVSAAELLDWINEGAQQVHEKLVTAYGEEYVSSSATLTATNGVAALPAGFFKLLSIEMSIAGRTRTLLPYTRQERNLYRNRTSSGYTPPRYSLVGFSIKLLPVMSGSIDITYAPEFTLLANPADVVTFPNGWEKYVVAYAAKQMLLKEESDVRDLSLQLRQWDDELEALKFSRDAAAPKQTVDMDAVEAEDWWP